jgi:hypothetical protein
MDGILINNLLSQVIGGPKTVGKQLAQQEVHWVSREPTHELQYGWHAI